jgi:hypothetical protein
MTKTILTLIDIAPFVGTLVSLEAEGDTDLRFAAHLAMWIYVLDFIMGSERTAGPYDILKDDWNLALPLVRVVNQIMTTARKQTQTDLFARFVRHRKYRVKALVQEEEIDLGTQAQHRRRESTDNTYINSHFIKFMVDVSCY